ncbi:MAG: flagellar motor protein MotB [Desulfopila sp.]
MAEEQQLPPEQKKEKKQNCPAGAPMWMVTYSDMVTLLLTFFVLLMSMASMDPVRFTQASNSLKDAFGMHNEPAQLEFALPILPSPPRTDFTPIQQEMTTKIYERLKAQLELRNLNEDVNVIEKDSDTIILRVNDSLLFKEGQAEIPLTAYPLLRSIADVIRPLPMKALIEGHTDDIRVGENPIDNWNLSVARAVAVMRFFRQDDLLATERMSAVGYGPDHPLVPNRDAASRAKNNRVDFVLRLDKLPEETKKPARAPQLPL